MPKVDKYFSLNEQLTLARQATDIPMRFHWFADESRMVWSLPTCLGLMAIVFTIVAYFRLTDTDEGLFLFSAKLVAHGKRPYFDFFYQQMPALPYVYALWSRIVGLSWISARMLSVILSVALGGLLYRHVERLYSRNILACLAVLLYAFNNLVIAWHPTVKTFALSNFLLFCAYLLVVDESKRASEWKLFLGGVLLAFAVDTRLYLIAAAPVLMVPIYWSTSNFMQRLKDAGLFLGGLVVGLLPNSLFIARNSDTYFFDNFGYHLIRSGLGFRAELPQKLNTFLAITNLQGSYDGSGVQFAVLSVLAIAAVLSRKVDRRALVPFAVASMLFIVCLAPSPTFPQYFCVCVPYLVLVVISFLSGMAESRGVGEARVWPMKKVGYLVLGLYLVCGILTVMNYSFLGTGVEGVFKRRNVFDYKVSTVKNVSKELGALVGTNDRVISFWPGYLVECDCNPEPGTENDFALFISDKLSSEDAARRKMITNEGVQDLLSKHSPRAVVVRSADVWGGWGIPHREALERNGYTLVRSIGRTDIYLFEGGDKSFAPSSMQ